MEEKDIKQACGCGDACECEDNCNCGEKCECENTCDCEECNCGDACHCDDACECDNHCSCDDDCECGEDCACTEEENCGCNKFLKKEEKKRGKHKKDKGEEKLKEAYEMIQTLEDKLLREKAETINFRRRKEEEMARMLKYANEDLIKETLEVVDNLERALDYDDEDASEEVKKFLSGFKMIYCNLVNTLEKFEVKAIDGANKAFDPTYHQAVMTEQKEGVEPGQVIDVLRKGYLLKDKVIRPAMVKVSE